jgi:hypothetical protein
MRYLVLMDYRYHVFGPIWKTLRSGSVVVLDYNFAMKINQDQPGTLSEYTDRLKWPGVKHA